MWTLITVASCLCAWCVTALFVHCVCMMKSSTYPLSSNINLLRSGVCARLKHLCSSVLNGPLLMLLPNSVFDHDHKPCVACIRCDYCMLWNGFRLLVVLGLQASPVCVCSRFRSAKDVAAGVSEEISAVSRVNYLHKMSQSMQARHSSLILCYAICAHFSVPNSHAVLRPSNRKRV